MLKTSEKLSPIVNNDKMAQLISTLQDFIVNGNLKPGMELLPERQLAQQLKVSRFSLREALRVAQAQGLIEITRGRRPRVANRTLAAASEVIGLTLKRSEKTFMDLLEARQGLECRIAKLAATRANSSHIHRLKQTIQQIEKSRDDVSFCVERDVEFHRILVEASGNVVFEIMLEPLADLLRATRLETMRRRGVQRAISGHRKILKAIIEKDPDQADKAMSTHLWMAKEDLQRIEQQENAI